MRNRCDENIVRRWRRKETDSRSYIAQAAETAQMTTESSGKNGSLLYRTGKIAKSYKHKKKVRNLVVMSHRESRRVAADCIYVKATHVARGRKRARGSSVHTLI